MQSFATRITNNMQGLRTGNTADPLNQPTTTTTSSSSQPQDISGHSRSSLGQRTALNDQTSIATPYGQETPNEYDYEKPPVPSRGESRDNVTPLPETIESKAQHSSNGMAEAPTVSENMRGENWKNPGPIEGLTHQPAQTHSNNIPNQTTPSTTTHSSTYGNYEHQHGQHAVSGRPKDAPETSLKTARAERSQHTGHASDVRPAQTHTASGSLLEQGEAALAHSRTMPRHNHHDASSSVAPKSTIPSTAGASTGLAAPGMNMPRLPSSHAEENGTGVKWVKSTGMAADGGNFDATKPGAGREADRLLDEAGITRTNAVHPPGTGSPAPATTDDHKPSLAEKLHLKKH